MKISMEDIIRLRGRLLMETLECFYRLEGVKHVHGCDSKQFYLLISKVLLILISPIWRIHENHMDFQLLRIHTCMWICDHSIKNVITDN